MTSFIVILFFLLMFIANVYIFVFYKKDILVRNKQVSEEKVKNYLLYLSSIIDTKNKEIEELSLLYDSNPDDKEIMNSLKKKQQEKDAIQEEVTKVIENSPETLETLILEKKIILKENEDLKDRIERIKNIEESGLSREENPQIDELIEKYNKLSVKYKSILEEYEDAKAKLEELDEEFTNIYN